jgi:hypothetical protein
MNQQQQQQQQQQKRAKKEQSVCKSYSHLGANLLVVFTFLGGKLPIQPRKTIIRIFNKMVSKYSDKIFFYKSIFSWLRMTLQIYYAYIVCLFHCKTHYIKEIHSQVKQALLRTVSKFL